MVYDAEDSIEEKENSKTLKGVIANKRRSVKAKNEYELNGKLIRFALSRGFEMNDVCRCLKGCEDFEE